MILIKKRKKGQVERKGQVKKKEAHFQKER